MSILTHFCHLVVLISCVNSLIIPEELPSLLSVIYSNIPPIKKGTDSRVGVGFRLGDHADFQVLLELGPQINTQPIGPNGDNKTRRQVPRPALIVQPVTATGTGTDTVADTPGGKWLSSWRSALVNPAKSSKFAAAEEQQVIVNPMEGKEHIKSHLHQLYKSVSKNVEDSINDSSSANEETTNGSVIEVTNTTLKYKETSELPTTEV